MAIKTYVEKTVTLVLGGEEAEQLEQFLGTTSHTQRRKALGFSDEEPFTDHVRNVYSALSSALERNGGHD